VPISGNITGITNLRAQSVAGGTVMLPTTNVPDTLVSVNSPAILTNKSLTSPVLLGATTAQGTVNVTGTITGYAGNATAVTVTHGIFSEVAGIHLTAQAANIASTLLYAIPSTASAALYRVSSYMIVTEDGGLSGRLPSCSIAWTDSDNAAAQTIQLYGTNPGNTFTNYSQGMGVFAAAPNTNISYSTTGYSSSGSPVLLYTLWIVLEMA
jgi:hypothetical protein